uniref:Dystroglycan n=1 Tax=Trichobilharzia regenti TaxID=157069 RepID=A0AA85KDS0_TRIRE|nr:unnamed protein product [Trichobilharzia regenti]
MHNVLIRHYLLYNLCCIYSLFLFTCMCENVEILIPTGKVFDIMLPINKSNHISWNLPQCLHVISKTDSPTNHSEFVGMTLRGFCFECDAIDENDRLLSDGVHNLSNYYVLAASNNHTNLTYTIYLINQKVENQLTLKIYSNSKNISLRHALLTYENHSWRKCYKQAPTILLLTFHIRICLLNYYERMIFKRIVGMFTNLKSNLSILHTNIPYNYDTVEMNMQSENYFTFESPSEYEKKLSILASAKAQNHTMPSDMINSNLVVLQHIGCGVIPDYILKMLTVLEKKLQNGLVSISELLGSEKIGGGKNLDNIKIAQWIVGDLIHHGTPDETLQSYNGNIKRTLNRRSVSSSREAGYLEEGSGMASVHQFPKLDYRSYLEHSTSDMTHSNIPRVKNYITPIKTTVYQISNIQIPQNTFHDLQDGFTQNLKLTLFASNRENISYIELKSMENLNQAIGGEITRDAKQWVSFDAKNQIIRLKPLPEHVGNHTFIICATDRDQNRACEPFQIIVKRPSPFRKNFILRIPPGVFWCYHIPIYWFKELKILSFDKLDLEVKGDSPFSWNVHTGEVCIVSSLKMEQIITLFFHATNAKLAQSVEIEFRLSAKVPPVELLVTNSKLRLKFSWPAKSTNYELHELNKINLTLAETLQNRVNPEVTSEKLFIYEIIQFKMPQNGSESAFFELDWVFLPLGLPKEGEELFLLSNESLLNKPTQNTNLLHIPESMNFYAQPNSIPKLSKLLSDCQLSHLDTVETVLQNKKNSFKPFVLESVSLLNLENSACFLVKRITKQLEEKVYSSASQQSGTIRSELSRWTDSHLYLSSNLQFMPSVVPNFTVTAGLPFKKFINPENITPSKRIQYMELRDAHGLILDDSNWMSLTLDNLHLIGLPLNEHVRKQAYLFQLLIHSVDQKTPIAVGFTVEVQDWYESVKRDKSFQHNHRVRLRILPPIQSPTSQTIEVWPARPANSLDYRWKLSSAIDQFLRPNCIPPCNPDVGIWQITQQNVNSLSVTWAQLSLLLEQGKQSTTKSEEAMPTCPWDKFDYLQNLLIFAPTLVSAQKNLGLVTGLANDGQLYLSPWSAPSNAFRAHIESSGLGIVEAAVVDRMGGCARHSKFDDSDITGQSVQNKHSSFSNFESEKIMNFTVFTGEGFRRKIVDDKIMANMSRASVHLYDMGGRQIGSSHWIGLEKDRSTIFGIIIGNSVQPSSHRFHITDNPEKNIGVQFSIYVAGSNPQLPSTFNHRVVMHFSADQNRPWTGGHSLVDRWILISALDDYLRPHCMGSMICRNDMDIILLTLNYHASGFSVIWAQKSVLILSGSVNTNKTAEIVDSYTQQEYWDQWSKNIHQNVKRSIDFTGTISVSNENFTCEDCKSLNLSTSPNNSHFKPPNKLQKGHHRNKRTLFPTTDCPEREIAKLENRLLVEIRKDLQHPSLNFVKHLKEAGVGQLDEIQIERLGPCARIQQSLPIFIPVPGLESTRDAFVPYYGKTGEYDESLHYIPSSSSSSSSLSSLSANQEANRHRMILLGTLLPICILLIIVLLGILGFVWYRKRGKSCTNGLNSHPSSIINSGHSVVNPETEKMLTTMSSPKKSTSNGRQAKIIKAGNMDSGNFANSSSQIGYASPKQPMILTNERPPFKPPDYNPGFTDSTDRLPMTNLSQSQMNNLQQISLQNTNEAITAGMMDTRNQPKASYALRPNPYRNLPPPIETKPGMPPPASQIPYAPYRKFMTIPNPSVDQNR